MAKESVENDLKESAEESSKKNLSGKITGVFQKIFKFKKIFKSKKTVILISVSFVLLIVLSAGAWFFFFKTEPEEEQAGIDEQKIAEETAAREQAIVFEDIVELEPFERIPLKSSSTMGLVSMNLSIELADQKYRKQIYTMESRIRDIITNRLQEMTWLELRNPGGKILLKYNLLKRINSIFPQLVVRNIYFTHFIMQ